MLPEVIGQDASDEVEVWGAYLLRSPEGAQNAPGILGALTGRVSCRPPSPPSLALIAAILTRQQ